MNTDELHHFKLGTLQCIAIRDDAEVYPITDLTTDVPEKQLAQALQDLGYPPTEARVDFNCLLIDTGEQKMLVDAGWGSYPERQGRLLDHLLAQEITPQDIDAIIITHGDGDHTGGLIDADGNTIFSSARHIMWKEAWNHWLTNDWLEEAEEVSSFRHKLVQALGDRVEIVEAETDFRPGLQLTAAPGHRAFHVTLTISSAGEHLLHLADAIVHPILVDRVEWRWPHHTHPGQAAEDKRRLLEWAVDHDALVFAAHFPFPGLGRVTRQGEGYHWQPIAT